MTPGRTPPSGLGKGVRRTQGAAAGFAGVAIGAALAHHPGLALAAAGIAAAAALAVVLHLVNLEQSR